MITYFFQFTIFVIELLEDSKALYKPCSRCGFNNYVNCVNDGNGDDNGDDFNAMTMLMAMMVLTSMQ